MKKQEFNQEISSLTELLKNKFPSTLTKRIELDDQFFTATQQFANEILDFSSPFIILKDRRVNDQNSGKLKYQQRMEAVWLINFLLFVKH